jgi:hypothetical protein
MIQGCCHLLDGLLQISDLSSNTDVLAGELERLFIYSLTWSVGGLLGMLTLLLMPLAGLHFCVGLDFVTPLVVIFFN